MSLTPELQWTSIKITSVVVGMLILVLVLAVCMAYHHHYHSIDLSRGQTHLEARTRPESPVPEPSYDTGTVRRNTGHPQTFYDWIQSGNANRMDVYEHQPSRDYSEGPAILNETSSLHSRSTIPQHVTLALVTPGRDHSVAQGSVDNSSLERAVLDAALQKEENEPVKADLGNGTNGKVEQVDRTVRGYSGAWP